MLRAALQRQFTFLASVPLVLEYEAVLTRPEQLEVSGLKVDEVGSFLDALAAVVEPVTLHFRWRPILSDPLDDMVLEVAVNGHADAVVTFNRRHFVRMTSNFQIPAILPKEAMQQLRKS